MEMYSPTAIEQAPATRLASPARRTTEGSADAPTTPRIRAMFVTRPSLMPSTAARAVPLWTLTASSTCSATPSTLDCGFAESMSSLRAYALALLQSETVVPSRADCAAASTTARARTPSAAGTGFGARPAHASRKAWSSTRSGSSRPVGSSSFPVSTASQTAVPLEMLAQVERDDRRRVVGDEGAALAHDHALAPGSGNEIVRLDDCGNVAVVHDGHGQIVEPATQDSRAESR